MTTIVVLIILATVVINLSLGDNGIFSRAREAKEQYQNAEDKEQADIAKATNEIDSYIDGNRGTVTISEEEYNTLKNANLYSTDEKKIGTWIDGKPLYRKVITNLQTPQEEINTVVTRTYQLSDYIENTETIVLHRLLLPNYNKAFEYLQLLDGSYLTVFISDTKKILIRLFSISQTGYSEKNCSLIIEYTKTTD